MKRRLKNKLITVILINICIFSVLYYSFSLSIQKIEDENNEYIPKDYFPNGLNSLGTSNELYYVDSIEDSQIIEIISFIEEYLKEYEEILHYVSFTGIYVAFGILTFTKNISIGRVSRESTSLKIEGVDVTEEEMKVFNLIQEFLSKNRILNKESVALYIKSRSKKNGNLNYNGINMVIDSLIKKKIIAEGSKLTRKTVLLNSNRKQMYNLIKQNPGIYKNKLAKILNLCPYVIKWHLSKLLLFNLIRERNLNSHIVYFDSLFNNENDDIFQIISREKCRRIIDFLIINANGCTKNQISKALNMHYNTVTNYIKEIDKYNLLTRRKLNQKELFILNENNYNKYI